MLLMQRSLIFFCRPTGDYTVRIWEIRPARVKYQFGFECREHKAMKEWAETLGLGWGLGGFAGRPSRVDWATADVHIELHKYPADKPDLDVQDLVGADIWVYSPKAQEVLGAFLQANCEELPCTMPEGYEGYKVYNTLTQFECLNWENCLQNYPATDYRGYINAFDFHGERLEGMTMFKDSRRAFAGTFVTEPFHNAVRDAGLTGIDLLPVWDSEAPQPFLPIYPNQPPLERKALVHGCHVLVDRGWRNQNNPSEIFPNRPHVTAWLYIFTRDVPALRFTRPSKKLFRSREEEERVKAIVPLLEQVRCAVDPKASFARPEMVEACLAHPLWDEVAKAAQAALDLMEANDRAAGA